MPTTPPAAEPERIALPRLEPGWCATVEAVAATGTDAAQLMAMGVCPGRRVVLVRHGDPLILRVLGTRIGVSARLAEQVIVRCGPLADCRTSVRGNGS